MAGARGPLPNPNKRRRNAPTIPTTSLPAAGRKGPAPTCPGSYKLKPAGRAWWRWAWKTPQAAAWDAGSLWALARRASLEDERAEAVKLGEVPTSILREMRELDERFGLTPKSLAALRWKIIGEHDVADDAAAAAGKRKPRSAASRERRARLSVVK